MADKVSGLVQGTLDMLDLKTLELTRRCTGYGIAMRIETNQQRRVSGESGLSLFRLAFRRLERKGWLASANGGRLEKQTGARNIMR